MSRLPDTEMSQLDDNALEHLVRANPSDGGPRRILIDRYFLRWDFIKALNLLDHVFPGVNDVPADVLYNKAECLGMLGRCTEAVTLYKAAIHLVGPDPKSAEEFDIAGMSHYNLYTMLPPGESEQHIEPALRYLEALLANYPDCEKPYDVASSIGELYLGRGDFSAAIDAFKRASDLCDNPEERIWSLVGLAGVYREQGDHESAQKLYREALVAPPENVRSRIHFEFGKLLLAAARLDEAREAFGAALASREKSPPLLANPLYLADVLWHRASVAYQQGDMEETTRSLEHVLALISRDHAYFANSHITLGHCYAAQNDYAKARDHYNLAVFAPFASAEQIELAQNCLKDIGEAGTA
jgi:tetratricopeptide (TPR) repeat protein